MILYTPEPVFLESFVLGDDAIMNMVRACNYKSQRLQQPRRVRELGM